MRIDTEQPLYREAVSIGWSLLWRTVGSFLVMLLVVNLLLLGLLPELTRTEPSLMALVFPLILATLGTALLVMPLVVRAILAKPFSGFRLTLVRDQSAQTRSHSTEPFTGRSGHEAEHGNRDGRHGAHAEPPVEPRAAV